MKVDLESYDVVNLTAVLDDCVDQLTVLGRIMPINGLYTVYIDSRVEPSPISMLYMMIWYTINDNDIYVICYYWYPNNGFNNIYIY